jgi:hypothetical protein
MRSWFCLVSVFFGRSTLSAITVASGSLTDPSGDARPGALHASVPAIASAKITEVAK